MARYGLTLVVLACVLGLGHCWWPFSSSEEAEKEVPEPQQLEMARFEMRTAEQKFLAEAQQFLDLSSLERCQYQVISRLRQSCGEMGEDELGKLSVALLNCQAQTEGRQTFQCSEQMTLAQCTTPMDATMWNAYHIISNRARSVCYATRQQQFRRQTELAVNQLSRSTLEQLEAMSQLSSSQQEVQVLAERSLDTMTQQQDVLMKQQWELSSGHASLQNRIAENLEQLTQEKAIIHNGQEQLANMTVDIRRQLEVASDMLNRQEDSRREGHSEIMADITVVRGNIKEVWERLDNSTVQLLVLMEDMSQKYQATLENLQLINSTVSSMLSLVSGMDAAINSQLQWLMEQLGGAQHGLKVLATCATHACFLLIATLCVLYVRAPGFARICLLLLVVGNAIGEIRFGKSLSLYTLTALELAVLIGNWLYLCVPLRRRQVLQESKHLDTHFPLPPLPSPATPPVELDSDIEDTPTPIKCSLEDEPKRYAFPAPGVRSQLHGSVTREAETLSCSPTKPSPTPTPVKPIFTPASTPRQRQCMAFTRTGLKCRLQAVPGSTRCHRHGN